MNCFLKVIGRLMVRVDNHYLKATRDIKAGDFHNYFAVGIGEKNRRYYLIFGKNDKPIVVYENEVAVL